MTEHSSRSEEAEDETAPMFDTGPRFDVGPRLQAVRSARGLSQRELARRARITNGSLSLIEQGKVSPSLASLEKILNAIPMSLPEFFAESTPTTVMHQAEDWAVINEGAARIRVMPLRHLNEKACYLTECELPGGSAEASGALLGKSGFVAGVVLEGHLELCLDGSHHALKAGDGFQFAGHRAQQFANPQENHCRFVLFVQTAKR